MHNGQTKEDRVDPVARFPSEGMPSDEHEETMTEGKIIRRNGSVVAFDRNKISIAVAKAFRAVRGHKVAESAGIREVIHDTTNRVVESLTRHRPLLSTFHIEEVQDQVELALMRGEHHDVARAYVLYREERAKKRREKTISLVEKEVFVVNAKGERRPLDGHDLEEKISAACSGLAETDPEWLLRTVLRDLYDGIHERDLECALYTAARSFIEREPQYSKVSARLLLDSLRHEVFGHPVSQEQMERLYAPHLRRLLREGIEADLLNPELTKVFDINKLGAALVASRDFQFEYLGLQTLFDRYFLHIKKRRIEMPQSFFMRVAMGLALREDNPTERAIEFYHLLSTFRFMSSTPTLFNSGTVRSQLSSCYLSTVSDDLRSIFSAYQENALLAKFAGGLGNDWTPVRSMGSHIKGTNGESQGVIPFLKIVNDTAVAVNQGGKRKGAVCVYLETWHLDILDFLDLRKNTGDERRRTHDMNTANWIPDLFMKRVCEGGDWTLLSPADAPDLHDLFGDAFERRYAHYESQVKTGALRGRTMPAVDLWRRMITMLFETGHPWMTFKDACNLRSPQQHAGVIHSSNLCTEITLNTDSEETAVCNLGSINLLAHIKDGAVDDALLKATIRTAMRMLDNVIDINYYSIDKAKNSNLKHRPVGLGIMGFQDCLYELGISYASEAAVEFADRSMEKICYQAYWASTELAEERGPYQTFHGSLWDRGIMPPDTLKILARERGDSVDTSGELMPADEQLEGDWLSIDLSQTLDWQALRERIKKHGMRNSNCVAIAPTATIANIVGVSASIEPTFQNIYVKSNLSGEFTVVNDYLVRELKALNLWDEVMLEDIKYFDGRLDKIDRIPAELRQKYPTVFEIEPHWLIECAARRQKWIDQAQSLNLYIAEPDGRKLDDMYKLAWKRGLKTTYYLRASAATTVEKYTSRTGSHNAVKACAVDDPDCEACQ